MVTGVGGTGVVTIGAIVGMAAHLEGKGFGALDMAGLAQKGGAVWSHLQIAAHPDDIKTVRLGSGGAKAGAGLRPGGLAPARRPWTRRATASRAWWSTRTSR